MTTYVNAQSNNTQINSTKTTMATVQVPAELFFQMMAKLDSIHSILTNGGIPVNMNVDVSKPMKKTKKVKKAKDPNAPKRPNTAHCLFLKAKAAQLGIGYKKTMSVPEVMAEWKEGTSSIVIDAKKKAEELKEQYEKDIAAYNASSTPTQVVADSDEEENTDSKPVVSPKPILKKRRGRPKAASSTKKVTVADPMAAILKEAAAEKKAVNSQAEKLAALKAQQDAIMKQMAEAQANIESSTSTPDNEEDNLDLEEFEYEGTDTKYSGMEMGIDLSNNKVYDLEGTYLGTLNSITKEIEGDSEEFDELEEDDLEDE